MIEKPHLRLHNTAQPLDYTSTITGSRKVFDLPPRDPSIHAPKLKAEIDAASANAQLRRKANQSLTPDVLARKPEGMILTFESDPGGELKLESLEDQRAGIKVVSVNQVDGIEQAKVFVPEGKQTFLLRKIDEYTSHATLTIDGDLSNRPRLEALADLELGIRVIAKDRPGDKVRVTIKCPAAEADRIAAEVSSFATVKKSARKNEPLIHSIAAVRLALVHDFWQGSGPPPTTKSPMWWEVWLHGRRDKAVERFDRFREIARHLGIRTGSRFIAFPERVVFVAYATATQFAESIDLLTMLSELRRAKELPTPYVTLSVIDQRAFSQNLLTSLQPPRADAPSVCLLDSGVNRGHPLLDVALSEQDVFAVDSEWGTADHDTYQHGTGMAGIALYGCLTKVLAQSGIVSLSHRLESVKILPPPPKANDPDLYGAITQQAASLATIRNPNRNRVYCMAVTSDSSDNGLPSSWSAALDEMCAGVVDETPKLFFVSAGNIRSEFHATSYKYHAWNCEQAGVEDPAQSWNAITVGAYTEKVAISESDFEGWQPLAEPGDLCPTSRTSLAWPTDQHKGWPTKPDFVCEGGNYVEIAGKRSSADDLSLLTTILHPSGRLFETTRDTSPATAEAARLAATLWSHYPTLRPETLRALLVHSSRWTDAMYRRFPGDKKSQIQRRLRTYGYGVPDLNRALYSLVNAVTLVYEGGLQPFKLDAQKQPKTNEMHLHSLPWPKKTLEDLGKTEVSMRVTLSYFIEPSPGRVGWENKHRYQSHGLRFDVIRPTEMLSEFRQRVSRAEWDDPKNPKSRPDTVAETRNWIVGEDGRTHGSIHSDWWTGTAAELAAAGHLAVYPVTGWWRERPHLGRVAQRTRYSLIISIETPDTAVDLYTPIEVSSNVKTEVLV
ncbi:S8 family peptidase [Telmatocola sphagniphila]|uniref:S8 family peptidase n=1 Tax=Telmatocola sphagniphila TaxID=1123043 RepID=A0A8E6EUL7_9BACT|nr:S8 family peptidase [Telmatocola sphagniphila]QVL31432.1 S8 family peptidase [Telmatocola sphagniphila]